MEKAFAAFLASDALKKPSAVLALCFWNLAAA